jgi:DNA repair protein RecN (Recombination protein N)
MLRTLRIEHLVLVDSCQISLRTGFHVITGETGSGKSVLLTAIGLLLGEKADASSVRHGEVMAVVEGEFVLPPSAQEILKEAEIELDSNECTLRREILQTGKSRAFVEGQLIPTAVLKRLGTSLVEISGQHACLQLQEPQTPQELVDRYGHIEEQSAEFQTKFTHFLSLTEKRQKLLLEEPSRSSEIERLSAYLDEIVGSKACEVDDEELFHRLQRLEHSKEIVDIASSMVFEIQSGKIPLQSALFKLAQRAEKLVSIDTSWKDVAELLETACASTKEAANELSRHLSSLDHSDEERAKLEAQLKRIDGVKRRWGPSREEIAQAKKSFEERLFSLQGREEELAKLDSDIVTAKEACDTLAAKLTKLRTATAAKFAAAVQKRLRALNMSKAILEIEVSAAPRSASGDDRVRLFCTPNVGEKRMEVREGASGGELARIYLAIQAVIADLFTVPTVLFDEIDASIGGITANAVGETLAAIGMTRQVLAVTHFSQVASKAQIHFAIAKEVRGGRTLTSVRELATVEERDLEHRRMAGTK